jgi:hypothetical protein
MEENKLCPFRQEIYKGNRTKSLDLLQEVRFGSCLKKHCAIWDERTGKCGFIVSKC